MRRSVRLSLITSGVPGFRTGVGLKPFGTEKIPSFFRKAVSCLTLLHDPRFEVSAASRKFKFQSIFTNKMFTFAKVLN